MADASVREHRAGRSAGRGRASPLTESPLEFIDTAGAGYDEELEPDGESRLNPPEADLVVPQGPRAARSGVRRAATSRVITPYAAQVRLLREQLPDVPGLEIDTVDGFQGREKEAIVISLVRSNAEGEIGFLADVAADERGPDARPAQAARRSATAPRWRPSVLRAADRSTSRRSAPTARCGRSSR